MAPSARNSGRHWRLPWLTEIPSKALLTGASYCSGRPDQVLRQSGEKEMNPSALKLRITSRTRSSLVNATFAIPATFIPWADSSTTCAHPPGHHRPTVTAHDPHQPAAFTIIDLTDPQAIGHWPSLGDQHQGRKHPAGQR